jgi:uncharacterized protein (TIGR00369 family)
MGERTYRWTDPAEVAQAFLGRSGLDALRGLLAGEIPPPPIAQTMGMRIVAVGDGTTSFAFSPQEWMCNPMGVIHGGILATVLDTVLTCCVFTKLPEGKACTTTDIQVRYLRPLRAGGPEIVVEGSAAHVGNTYATAEARAVDATGKLYAHATTGLLIIKPGDFAAR